MRYACPMTQYRRPFALAASAALFAVAVLPAAAQVQGSLAFAAPDPGRAALARALLGLGQLGLTFVLGLAVVYGSYRLLGRLFRGLDLGAGLAKGSLALGLTLASFLFGIVLLMKRSLYPVFALLEDLARDPEAGLAAWGEAALRSLAYVGLSFAVAAAIALASIWLFDRLTKEIKELEEIRKDNLAVAVFFSGVFLSMAFFMEAGLHGLLVSLIPGMSVRLP